LISAELDLPSCEPERSIKSFQEIASFLGRRIDDWQKSCRKIEVTQADEIAIAEYMRTEQQLIDKYGIKIVDNGRFDHTSENFAEFTDTLRLFREEEVDLRDLTPLTEDEAIIAVSKIDAPIGVIATIKDLLN
jgi:hypothetical protein